MGKNTIGLLKNILKQIQNLVIQKQKKSEDALIKLKIPTK